MAAALGGPRHSASSGHKGGKIQDTGRYIRDHWYGRHSLVRSFWVNFVLLRAALFAIQEAITPEDGRDLTHATIPVLALVVIFHGGLFVWQAVGVLRSAERHVRGSGTMVPVWGTQLSLLVATLWVLSYGLEAWQVTQPQPDDDARKLAQMEADRAARYSLTYAPEQGQFNLQGTLELGVTARLTALLDTHPEASRIALTSAGGNIYEARGLAAIIRRHGLATHVPLDCSSSCTTVFIAGKERTMAPGARLGFHQYRIDATYSVPFADPASEQDRDRALFRQSGVAEWFLDKMFNSEASGLWIPDITELRRANVVTSPGSALD